jgi:transcriptional regulator with XRE-family HTH domain
MHMGTQLRRLLKRRGISQAKFAKDLGYKRRQDVNNLCRNEKWDVETVWLVSDALKVDPCYFFPRSVEEPMETTH